MDSSGITVWLLALVTFVIVIALAIWQRRSVAKAKDTHEHTAMTRGHPEQRRSDGSDPGTKPH